MTLAERLALGGYGLATRALTPLLPWHLRRRAARGKEIAARLGEKQGRATLARPEGPLVWLHAVGLGEALALRGLVARLEAQDPALRFLLTSGTRASAEALARDMPPQSRHQFAPLDTPAYGARFLDHWRPDLAIWSEQEMWPGLIVAAHRRGVPLALVNARMNAAALARRRWAAVIYGAMLRRFALVSAQDAATAAHLRHLGAGDVRVDGSLKLIAPPLADHAARAQLGAQIGGRRVWLAASVHPEDDALVLDAHLRLRQSWPEALVIIAPRDPARAPQIAAQAAARGLSHSLRHQPPQGAVYIANSLGEMGLWYRLCPVAYVGGSMGPTEGHNPWEAARLGAAVLHGSRTANFAADYAQLSRAQAARLVAGPEDLAAAIMDPQMPAQARRAGDFARAQVDQMDGLCHKLRNLM